MYATSRLVRERWCIRGAVSWWRSRVVHPVPQSRVDTVIHSLCSNTSAFADKSFGGLSDWGKDEVDGASNVKFRDPTDRHRRDGARGHVRPHARAGDRSSLLQGRCYQILQSPAHPGGFSRRKEKRAVREVTSTCDRRAKASQSRLLSLVGGGETGEQQFSRLGIFQMRVSAESIDVSTTPRLHASANRAG